MSCRRDSLVRTCKGAVHSGRGAKYHTAMNCAPASTAASPAPPLAKRCSRALRQSLLGVLLASMLVRPVPAQINTHLPDLGDSSQAGFSPAMERRVGEQVMREIRFREKTYVNDAELEDYLNRIGNRLVVASGSTDPAYTFFAMRDPSINAFAMPGGLVGVHTGLLLASQSESELASVLAHEIAHVQQRHIARMLQQHGNATVLVLLSLVAAILASRSNSQVTEALVVGGQAAAIQQQLGFSREHEQEADRMGLQILDAAGFDVRGMPSFFERMRSANRINETGGAPGYLRTHPLTVDRIADTAGRAREMPYRQVQDSLDYTFLRAKVDADTGTGREALARLLAREATRPTDVAARWYGLSRAYLRERELAKADEALARLRETNIRHATIESLAIDLASAKGQHQQAAEMSRAARVQYPGYRALQYREAEAWLAAKRPQEALRAVGEHLAGSKDATLFELQARAYAALNQPVLQHRALAELYVLQGSLPAAIDQLQIAQRNGGGDFYEQSIIDARLRELRVLLREEMAERAR